MTTVFVSTAAIFNATSEIFKLQWSSVFLVFYLSQSNEKNRQNAFMYISRLSLGKLWMIVNNILGLFLVTSLFGRFGGDYLTQCWTYFYSIQVIDVCNMCLYANCQQKDILNSEMDYSRARGRKWSCKHVDCDCFGERPSVVLQYFVLDFTEMTKKWILAWGYFTTKHISDLNHILFPLL